LLGSCLLILLSFPGFAQEQERKTGEAEAIVERVLERALWVHQQGYDSRYSFKVKRVSEKLDKDGQSEGLETESYENVVVGGHSFERLVEKDGRTLSEREVKEEDKRQGKFLREAEEGNASERGQEFEIRRELLGRYQFDYLGLESLEAQPHHVLSFWPREGKLPVRNRMDQALNKAEGRIWVDPSSYEIARVEFDLKENLRVWWGIIGTIHEVTGQVRREEIDDGVWYSTGFDLYLRGRMLFSSLHRKMSIRWSEFELLSSTGDQAAFMAQ